MESMMVKHGYSKHKRKELLFMTPDDVKLLYQEGHAIGLHSHSHPTQFCELGYEKQLMEYTKNLEIIRSITTEGVWSMSHPSGSYNDETLTILKELGIRIGFRSTPSEKNIKSCFEIPREDHATVFKYISSL